MYPTPLSFLGPLGGKRMLICGIGVESVAFTLAGADVYGFGGSVSQVEAVKDLARGLALRDRIHLQTGSNESAGLSGSVLRFGVRKDGSREC